MWHSVVAVAAVAAAVVVVAQGSGRGEGHRRPSAVPCMVPGGGNDEAEAPDEGEEEGSGLGVVSEECTLPPPRVCQGHTSVAAGAGAPAEL